MISRILYVGPADISSQTGPAVNEYEFIAAASRIKSVAWRFLVPELENALPSDLSEVAIRFYPNRGKGIKGRLWFKSETGLAKLLQRELVDFDPDLVVLRPGVLPYFSASVLRKSCVPLVLRHCPTGSFKEFDRIPFMGSLLRIFNQQLIRSLRGNVLNVQLMSEAKLDLFRVYFPEFSERSTLTRNAVNLTRFPVLSKETARSILDLPREAFIIGYVGNYPWRRGGRSVIDVVKVLNDRGYSSVTGLIVGDSGDLVSLRSYADDLGVGDAIRTTGRVSFDSVATYVSSFDVGLSILLPSEIHASPQKALQYVACGRPILANHPDVQHLVDAGLGQIVDNVLDELTASVVQWMTYLKGNADSFEIRARRYAEQNLSYVSRVRDQLDYWNQLKSLDEK